jgi:tryptophan synthase alpha chain
VRALDRTFQELRARGRRAFVAYVTAGHPDPARMRDVLACVAEAGADVIELGVPFSDPLADGPVIQKATWAALGHGVTPARVLEWVAAWGSALPPIVLFTYVNPVLRYGPARFVRDAASAGAAGLLVTDLPLGADPALEAELRHPDLAWVRLVAPTTAPSRVRAVAAASEGFLYYISRTGVTGPRPHLAAELRAEVQAVRAVSPVPVAVGFGISTGEQARQVAEVADGVVVGSAIVAALDAEGLAAAERVAREIRAGIDAAD